MAILPEVRILRPGSISRTEIESLLGYSVESGSVERRAPGQYVRHYAPKTPVRLVPTLGTLPGLGFGVVGTNQIQMPSEPVAYASSLYAYLRELDRRGLEAIHIERPPETSEWEAIWDRLRKAATPE